MNAPIISQLGLSPDALRGETVIVTGAGFAVSVVFVEKFRGQEISSIQALKAADIHFGAAEAEEAPAEINGIRPWRCAKRCSSR